MRSSSVNFKQLVGGIVIFMAIIGGLGLFLFTSFIPDNVAPKSFPRVDGEIRIEGLEGNVDIYRDEMGIPHIYASTVHDLFFAQGYVHAQERFWQMDFWRHIGSGRLSEMFGESQLETDMFLRSLGWRQIAEAEYLELPLETKQLLLSYSEGVNAYIAERQPVEISLEYLILTNLLNREYVIEPWEPVHSMTWGKAMAWDLAGNMDTEIERAILLENLTLEQVNELFPLYPEDHPVIVPEIGGTASPPNYLANPLLSEEFPSIDYLAVADKFHLLDSYLSQSGSGIGSNSWVISGELTNTGMPLLANDPHLGIQMPSIWFQVNLHCAPKTDECPFEIGGFSFAGVPGVVIGHNDYIAWGFTNVGPDVMDLFIERVNPDNPNQYEVDGEWVDFETREEVIKIAGKDPYIYTVRLTRHGPVVNDTYGLLSDEVDPADDPDASPFKEKAGIALPDPYVISLAWTALLPSSPLEAVWGFNISENWEEFREAAQHFHVPAQNLIFADIYGNIGYQMPGDIPIRKNGDGRVPVPGWTGEYDWIGYIPFEELPYAYNPEKGYIVTANNMVPPWDYPYMVGTDWDYGFRAERIVNLIENAPGGIGIPYIQEIQRDSKNLNAEVLVPILMEIDLDPAMAEVRDSMFSSWDYQQSANSQSAALFEWFWWNLLMGTFDDDLPEDYWPGGGSRWFEVMRNLVKQPDSDWWDDKDSEDVVETRNDIFAEAISKTVDQIEKDYGKNRANWPMWGELHSATFRNATLGESGIGPIEALFNRGAFNTGGGESVVNATGWTVGESFEVDWLPSMRMIIDLGNLQNSLAIHTTGESGHAYHPHYIDMAPLWADGKYYPMYWELDEIMSNAESHLRMVPD